MRRKAIDEKWMRQAIELARHGLGKTRPNPAVGAVIVKAQVVVGAGYHRRAGTDHAEVVALKNAGNRAKGAVLYVTLEPCCSYGRTPPCTDAIIRSGIRRVAISVRDPNPEHRGKGVSILQRAGIDVTEGVCAEEGLALILPFAKWINTRLPYLTLKLGMSVDGKIGDIKGMSRWITSDKSRAFVHHLRQEVDAVLVGSGTACHDDPSLLPEGRPKTDLLRVVADSAGRLPLRARLLNDGHEKQTVIATTRRCPMKKEHGYAAKGAAVWKVPSAGGRVSLRKLFALLGKHGILHVLCEGGGELAESLIRERLVDEFLFIVAPRILGGTDAVAAIPGRGWELKSCPKLEFVECRQTGEDLLIKAVPAENRRSRARVRI